MVIERGTFTPSGTGNRQDILNEITEKLAKSQKNGSYVCWIIRHRDGTVSFFCELDNPSGPLTVELLSSHVR